jgi:nucleoside-diphosphate-sugar epimerase
MKILLTGANGFVGSHIAERLAADGHAVKCMVRPTADRRWLQDGRLEYCVGNIADPDSIQDAVKDVEAVVHSAGVLRALRREDYFAINQRVTGNLARILLEVNPSLRKLVFISSQAAMGPSSGPFPKRLDEPETPLTDYGQSKLAGERELAVLRGKIPFTIVRPASVYGPRDRDIFIFFSLVHRGLRPLPLARRLIQLVYVADVAAAVSAALTSPATDYKTYFLAEDTPYTWQDVASAIAGVLGRGTIPLPLPDCALHAAGFGAEMLARLRNVPAVLNRQKIREMLAPYWLGDPGPARRDMALDFTNLKIGAKITYLWYKNARWF